MVSDDAFPLKKFLMKPYQKQDLTEEEKVCNYRFSWARRVSENAFGIFESSFKVFLKPIIALKSLDAASMML